MPGRVNKMPFKHIYSTFQSILVQTHQSWMLIHFNFAKIWKHSFRPPPAAFAYSSVSWLWVKTQLVRTGHIYVLCVCGCERVRLKTDRDWKRGNWFYMMISMMMVISGQIEIKESKRQRGQEWFCVLLSVSALHSLTRSANNSNSLLLSLLYIQILVWDEKIFLINARFQML